MRTVKLIMGSCQASQHTACPGTVKVSSDDQAVCDCACHKHKNEVEMKLLTKELQGKLPPLYANENTKDPVAVCKFFTPDSNWTWYATEACWQNQDGEFPLTQNPSSPRDVLFFGLVVGLETELGYFSLSELEESTGPLGLHIERDLYFKPTKLSEINDPAVKRWYKKMEIA